MTAALALDLGERPMWSRIDIEDPRGRELADRHYSRQTPGADGYAPPGRRFAFYYDDDHGEWRRNHLGTALWIVVYNLDPVGNPRWRNTMFHNESAWLSSWLCMRATEATFAVWLIRYKVLPAVRLTTEIDIKKTASRRSKSKEPGVCFLEAGWEHWYDAPAEHGRSAKRVLWAPPERFGVAA